MHLYHAGGESASLTRYRRVGMALEEPGGGGCDGCHGRCSSIKKFYTAESSPRTLLSCLERGADIYLQHY